MGHVVPGAGKRDGHHPPLHSGAFDFHSLNPCTTLITSLIQEFGMFGVRSGLLVLPLVWMQLKYHYRR